MDHLTFTQIANNIQVQFFLTIITFAVIYYVFGRQDRRKPHKEDK